MLRKCRVYSADDGDGYSDQMDRDDSNGDYYRAFDVDREIERLTKEHDKFRAALERIGKIEFAGSCCGCGSDTGFDAVQEVIKEALVT